MKTINIEPIKLEIKKIKEWVKPITDNKSCKIQADNLKAIKFQIKEINKKRTTLVKPLNDTVKNINEIFKPILEECQFLKDQMTDNILKYQRIEIERQQEAERKEREAEIARIRSLEIDKVETKEIVESIANRESSVIKGVDSDWAKTRIRDNWVYEIVDAEKVPKNFLSPDHAKIMSAIKLGVRELPGINIYNKGSVGSY